MKNGKVVIIAIACICLICGGFFLFTKDSGVSEKELTEVEKVIVKDLSKNYPKTPREVVKFYNRIIECYYGEKLTNSQIEDLADQTLVLLDEDLLLVNPRDEYLRSIKEDIQEYQEKKKVVVSSSVCDSNEVVYLEDKVEGTTEVDEIAFVNGSYFINNDGQFTNTYQQFVLRKDVKGQWKILAFYEIEGETSEDD